MTSCYGVSGNSTQTPEGDRESTLRSPSGPITLKGIYMTIFLIILLVIAVGVIIQQYRYRRRITKHSTWLESEYMTIQEKLGDAYSAYAALETGQQEIIDNYENDFLSMGEQVEAAKNAAKYDREKREEVEGLLALKDKIIEKHAGTCDSILAEVVNEMVAELRPSDE